MMGENKNIKAYIINYMAGGVPYMYLLKGVPTFVTSPQVMDWLQQDPSACWIGDAADDRRTCRCDPAGPGNCRLRQRSCLRQAARGHAHLGITCPSPLRAAPRVIDDVQKVRLPKWLAQRDLPGVSLI